MKLAGSGLPVKETSDIRFETMADDTLLVTHFNGPLDDEGLITYAERLGAECLLGTNTRELIDDLVFGMFRKWESEREDMGHEARVFCDHDAALAWLNLDPPQPPGWKLIP